MKRIIPDILTATRIVFSVALLFFNSFTVAFWILYVLCGITDISDGFFARKFSCESKFGKSFDSAADLIFACVLAIKIVSGISFPLWSDILIILILILKTACMIISALIYGKPLLLHSFANKLSGAVVFITVFFMKTDIFAVIPAIVISMYASIEELYLISTKKNAVERLNEGTMAYRILMTVFIFCTFCFLC